MYYTNINGLKRCWGTTAQYGVAGNSSTSFAIILPIGFFSSITGVMLSLSELTVDARQVGYLSSAPTTTVIYPAIQGLTGTTTTIGGKVRWEVTGT